MSENSISYDVSELLPEATDIYEKNEAYVQLKIQEHEQCISKLTHSMNRKFTICEEYVAKAMKEMEFITAHHKKLTSLLNTQCVGIQDLNEKHVEVEKNCSVNNIMINPNLNSCNNQETPLDKKSRLYQISDSDEIADIVEPNVETEFTNTELNIPPAADISSYTDTEEDKDVIESKIEIKCGTVFSFELENVSKQSNNSDIEEEKDIDVVQDSALEIFSESDEKSISLDEVGVSNSYHCVYELIFVQNETKDG